ncbi:Cold shock-like protein CspB, partial [Durusdinium trenchii]
TGTLSDDNRHTMFSAARQLAQRSAFVARSRPVASGLARSTQAVAVRQFSILSEDSIKGTVKWFDARKGFGFIDNGDGEGDIFVHFSNINRFGDEYRSLEEEEEVTFTLSVGEDGKRSAENVTRARPPFGSVAHADVLHVCEGVVALFDVRIPGDVPQAITDELPRSYAVVLTCLSSKRFNQLVYQLGHELTHVFADPMVEHPFMEVLACTVSLSALELTAAAWQQGPSAAKIGYAAKFVEYKNRIVEAAWQHSGAPLRGDEEAVQRWTRTCDIGLADRNAQLVAASLLEPAFTAAAEWQVLRAVRRAWTATGAALWTLTSGNRP